MSRLGDNKKIYMGGIQTNIKYKTEKSEVQRNRSIYTKLDLILQESNNHLTDITMLQKRTNGLLKKLICCGLTR